MQLGPAAFIHQMTVLTKEQANKAIAVRITSSSNAEKVTGFLVIKDKQYNIVLDRKVAGDKPEEMLRDLYDQIAPILKMNPYAYENLSIRRTKYTKNLVVTVKDINGDRTTDVKLKNLSSAFNKAINKKKYSALRIDVNKRMDILRSLKPPEKPKKPKSVEEPSSSSTDVPVL